MPGAMVDYMDAFFGGVCLRTLKHYVQEQTINLLYARKIILENFTKIEMTYSTKQRKIKEEPKPTIFLH